MEWAAGGRGQPLVDAAAEALAAGLDSPTLRILAGAPRATADEEASELAPAVFDELELHVHERMSTEAIVEGARQLAGRFLANGGSPRALARAIHRMDVAADYPAELATWSGLAEWYNMLENGVISDSADDVEAATIDAARLLVEARPAPPVRLDRLFVGRSTRRSRVTRRLGRRRR